MHAFQRKNRLYLLLRIRPQKNPADEGFAIVFANTAFKSKTIFKNFVSKDDFPGHNRNISPFDHGAQLLLYGCQVRQGQTFRPSAQRGDWTPKKRQSQKKNICSKVKKIKSVLKIGIDYLFCYIQRINILVAFRKEQTN
jgi:hypothetical protein